MGKFRSSSWHLKKQGFWVFKIKMKNKKTKKQKWNKAGIMNIKLALGRPIEDVSRKKWFNTLDALKHRISEIFWNILLLDKKLLT